MKQTFYALLLAGSCCYGAAQAQEVAPSGVEDGAILHCWNWSFANITSRLDRIAQQGFKAIQTSPIQPTKQKVNGAHIHDWYFLYQPVDFKIGSNTDEGLGTREEFRAMCEAAEQKGIKVIVDVVANHTANESDNVISPKVADYLRSNDAFWHKAGTFKSAHYNDRGDFTWNTLNGVPDLNTANKELQQYVITFLKDCIDCGADGFRFDAAKHIATPVEHYQSGTDDFWPSVVGAANDYAKTKGQSLFIYGEILDNATGPNDRSREREILDSYLQYMSITANVSSNNVRHAVVEGNAGRAADSYIGLTGGNGIDASISKAVLWAESHDTYAAGENTRSISDDKINLTWALVGSRSNAPALYLARPQHYDNNNMTGLGKADETAWTREEVKAVNELRKATKGKPEYLSHHQDHQLVLNERGEHHAVVVALGGHRQVNLKAYQLVNGTYRDALSQTEFTVAGQQLTGTIGSTGIAVLSLTKAQEGDIVVTFDNTGNWPEVAAYVWNAKDEKPFGGWPGKKMEAIGDNKYCITIPAAFAKEHIIFNNNNQGQQTANLQLYGHNEGYRYSGHQQNVPRFHTLNVAATGYATLFLDYATTIPNDVTAHTATVSDKRVTITPIEGNLLAANTAVVVKGQPNTRYDFVETTTSVAAVSANDLKGGVERLAPEQREANQNYYILVVRGEQSQFVRLKAGDGIPAHRAYLTAPASLGVQGFSINGLTAIEAAPTATSPTEVYDLAGRRVLHPASGGLYITSGVKYVQP